LSILIDKSTYHLTAAQAAAELRVTPATLYAYVSRGLLHSEPVAGRSRERRYAREDVARLKARQEARRDPARAAAPGLHWGGPVLESAITLIHDGALYYRGRDAIALANTETAEGAAALLWNAPAIERARIFDQPCPLSPRRIAQLRACAGEPFALLQAALPVAAVTDLASFDLRPAAVRHTGGRIIRLFATLLLGRPSHEPLHRCLQQAWAPNRRAVGEVIRTALVLCADHELNVSTFTARCAASAGASPYDVVTAAMATLKGYKHGGGASHVIALAAEARTPATARAAIAQRLRRGEQIPGFGHPLYPRGDPRATSLLRLAAASGNEAAWRPYRLLTRAGTDVLGDAPNLDCGLAAITAAYRLPAEAPLILFAAGRTLGWIAHAIEEYASGKLIRPRARYVGPPPL